jgi:hypothetical protein
MMIRGARRANTGRKDEDPFCSSSICRHHRRLQWRQRSRRMRPRLPSWTLRRMCPQSRRRGRCTRRSRGRRAPGGSCAGPRLPIRLCLAIRTLQADLRVRRPRQSNTPAGRPGCRTRPLIGEVPIFADQVAANSAGCPNAYRFTPLEPVLSVKNFVAGPSFSILVQYLRTIGFAAVLSGAAGEMASVTHAVHPSGRFSAAKSL